MSRPITEQDLADLALATREALDRQDAAISSLVKSFLSFRREVRDFIRQSDQSFEGVGQDFAVMEEVIRAMGGGQFLAVIEPDCPEKEEVAAAEPPPQKRKLH